ncbi:MAG: divalent-cation tolerance protein CutA [Nitrospinae bacterium]|nr:divalent-cation tolerance protein CutA [Nitrospinota bacterium]
MTFAKKNKNDSFVVIFITTGSLEEAEKIGRGLVEERLAACVNIIQPIKSFFSWEGKLCQENEVLLMVKSRADIFTILTDYVKKNHSYKVPEIITIPITDGLPGYLNWLDTSCKNYSEEANQE